MIRLTTEHQNKIIDAKNYNDSYFVDVLLKNGIIRYNLSVREKVSLEPTANCSLKDYNFKTDDIEDIRPTLGILKKLNDPWKKKKETI